MDEYGRVDAQAGGGQFIEREGCPACLSKATCRIYREPFTSPFLAQFLTDYYKQDVPSGVYELNVCQTCSLVFQRFVGSEQFLKKLYSDWLVQGIDENYRHDLEFYSQSRDGHELISLSAFLRKPSLKVLDYGTGWGLWPIIARRLGHEAYATEWAAHKAEWVEDHGVIVLSSNEISQHRFDVINLEQTLEHLTDPRDLLHKLAAQLDGVLKIAVPNVANPMRIVKDLKRRDHSSILPLMPFEHINGFNESALRSLAAAFGLEEVRPSLRESYAFVSTGMPRPPGKALKELVRPLWSFRSRTNLYRWFGKRKIGETDTSQLGPAHSRRAAALSR